VQKVKIELNKFEMNDLIVLGRFWGLRSPGDVIWSVYTCLRGDLS